MIAYQGSVKEARNSYFSKLIAGNRHNPRVLFKAINAVVGPSPSQPIEARWRICKQFLHHFINKIDDIRLHISPETRNLHLCSDPSASLSHFNLISLSDLKETINHLNSSTCLLDTIPTRLLKEVVLTVSPHILSIINCSLSTGFFPSSLKKAIVRPLLKKPTLDPLVLNNFRPISNLPFLSKILEKSVAVQLINYLNYSSMFEKYQSGFRAHHSTETALIKVTNDLLLSVDSGSCAILILLDLSSVFDTVDHGILLDRLENHVGIKDTALAWFRSYLADRTFSVALGEFSSSTAPLSCGVPQGSILGPLLFSIYMLPLGQIIRNHDINFHCYADDTQIYVPLTGSDMTQLSSVLACLSDIKCWMSQNFLQLNESKSEVLLFGPSNLTNVLKLKLGELSSNVQHSVRNLGVMFDHNLAFDVQITKVVQSCFLQIRNIAKVKHFLSRADLEIVIHAFISSRLDYCNSLYSGLSLKAISRLQFIQNAAARLLTNSRKYDHINPILAELHWLPVKYRIDFKLLLITFKALHGLAPAYIPDLLKPYEPGRCLRSSGRTLLATPTARLVTKGDRAFSVRAPQLWNSLPEDLRLADTVHSFKSRLKTYFYRKAFLE